MRANIYRAPTRRTLVDVLVERGYDVWLEHWRGSIDMPPNPWTLTRPPSSITPRRFAIPPAARVLGYGRSVFQPG